MAESPLLELGLVEAAAELEAGRIDPVSLTEAYLARIAATEPEFNCYVTVDADGARAAASAARDEISAGRYRGPLHGIPVGVKDIFDTAGLRTTYGSIRYVDNVPTADAVAVARLRSAGAVILGKQATHEFAWGGRTDSPHFGPTHNPHDRSRIPGGSSGGGAASVVARSCLVALGSDTAGSVRIPAALCGCAGFKPARGWIDLTGAFPLAPSLDHAGILARSAADARLAYQVLSGRVTPARALPRRVGFLVGPSAELVDEAIGRALADVRGTLADSGVDVVDVDLHGVDERALALLTLLKSEAELIHRAPFQADPGSYGPDLAELLSGPAVTREERTRARIVVDSAVAELRAALADVEVLVGATEPILAPLIGQMTVDLGGRTLPVEHVLTRLTSLANAAGVPAISVPAPGAGVLPAGVQAMSRDDALGELFAVAEAVEAEAEEAGAEEAGISGPGGAFGAV